MGQNVIELNGKRYDALTGVYLGKSHVIPKHITERYVHGRVIDGFVRPSHPEGAGGARVNHKGLATTTEPTPKSTINQHRDRAPTKAETRAKPHHSQASHPKVHKPEHAKTLMGRATRKPEFSLKPAIRTQAPAELAAKPMSAIAHKRSAYGIDPVRHQRATLTNRHNSVSHFRSPAIHAVSSEVPVIAVRPVPLRAAQPVSYERKHVDIFEAAIAHATSHQQPEHKVRRHRGKRRLINSLAVASALLLITGFVSYLNLPQLELRVASIQAGFGASMPHYTPTGYALEGGVKRAGGTVSLSFTSGDSQYRITQQSSNWNSQTLLDNTLALNGDHETIQKNGQTIYIYKNGGTNAAWVNGGVRYDLSGNAQLSKDEIINIATSL